MGVILHQKAAPKKIVEEMGVSEEQSDPWS